MRSWRWVGLWGAVIVLAATEGAFAWGPAEHIAIGGSLLEQLALLPSAIAILLARHRFAYLYGSIAADIVFAKRWSRVKQFCHHWSTGFKLLESSEAEGEKAFAYGYLSHLAADTVAHGKFVPRQVMMSGCSVNFGHLYWELRADDMQSAATWSRLGDVLESDHADHHALLATHIRGTFLPFGLNRVCFKQLNALAIHPGFRQTVNVCSRLSRSPLSSELLDGYHRESVDRVLDVLTNAHRSCLLREDPNGTSSLMQIQVHRRHVRRLRRAGAPTLHHTREAALGLAPKAPPETLASNASAPRP